MHDNQRPICLIIGALGGEGGGVLADWITEAATAEGFPVQRTSVPGVAQRTGATTYYIEILPIKWGDLGSREPVLALFPNPGTLDLVVATEVLEAGRAMERGFVTPDRTTLIASTHRIFAIAEKSVPSDGRYNSDHIVDAAKELARQPILFDIAALSDHHGVSLNAVLLGMIAASGVLPFVESVYREAIRQSGKAVDENLRGFDIGLHAVREPSGAKVSQEKRITTQPSPLMIRAKQDLPDVLHEIAAEALPRLTNFQNRGYAERWVIRLVDLVIVEKAAGLEPGFVTEQVARQLALWMSFEDIIRVAEVKSRSTRQDFVMGEIGAKAGQVVRVTEFLKPGIPEWSDMLPPAIGKRLRSWAERRGKTMYVALHIRSDTVLGFFTLYLLARLRWWRPRTLRFAEENTQIDAWIGALKVAMLKDADLARELAELPRLRKGYGETRSRGVSKFVQVMSKVVTPWLTDSLPPDATTVLNSLRQQALSDPDDSNFDRLLDRLAVANSAAANASSRIG